jgi:quercetin dioxygenase-like cupin family protein
VKHVHYEQVELEPVEAEGAERAGVRWLISEQDGAPNFSMRRFELEPGGATPFHEHPWEHEVFVLEGKGTLRGKDGDESFRAGDVVLIRPGERHGFCADRGVPVAFLCLIPREGKR